MGIALPQLAPASTDRVSGAQVINGSLKFDGSESGGDHYFGHLKRTSSGASGGGTFTISWWAKRGGMRDDWQYMIGGTNGSLWGVGFPGSSGTRDSLTLFNGSHQYSSARFRDNSGWYHIVLSVDAADGPRLWVNGELQSNANTNTSWNLNNDMYIGKWVDSGTAHNFDGYLAQYTCIDGLELGPSYFAYTDPLTGAWRPKKFVAEGTTVNDGTVWSDSSSDPSSVVYSGAATSLFDGNLSSGGLTLNKTTTSSNQWYEALTGVSIPCNNSVAFYSANGASTATMRINGDDNLKVEATTTTNGWWALNFEGIINKIELGYLDGSGSQNTFYGIQIDGVTLINSTTQNLAFGSAGFYLPLDGNTPIGEDLSGNGNDWRPEGFGGSVALDHPTVSGARPILNTVNGGTSAAPGVFGSKENKTYVTTTANGGVYQFDITSGDNPSLEFIRGATYKFDYSSHTGHPVLFSSTNPDSSTTAYTTGTSISSNVISFTVPHDAPDTLYYYCQNHPTSMNGAISVTTDETKADKYAANCVLAMPLVGSNRDFSDEINCTTTAKTLAPQGNVTQSSGQSNWYGESYYFDGSGDYLGATSNADFAMGTGDFTLECWVYKSSSGAFMNFMATRGGPGTSAGFTFGSQSAANGYDIEFYTDGLKLNGGDQGITNGRWHHVAVTRSGTSLRSYVNGVLNTTATNSQNLSNTSLALGITNDATQGPLHGYLQDVRIYKGVAKYSGGSVGDQVFIVPATEPNITPDSPSGVATKSKLKKMTDGAVSFNGSDYLKTTTSSSDFTFGTGDFTVEMFLYNQETSGNGFIQFSDTAGGLKNTSSGVITIHKENGQNGVFRTYAKNTSTAFSTPVPYKRWCHVALVRESGTIKLFVDGKQDATTISSDTTDYATTYAAIGGYYDTNYLSDCIISNVRVNKGTALYTSDFKPPTEKLTNVTNTKLLTCHTPILSASVAPLVSGVNDGTVWSGATLSNATLLGNLFDGDNSTSCQQSTNGTAASITNFGPVNVSSTVSFYSPDGDARYTLNGGAEVSVSGTGWHDISFSGQLTHFTFQAPGNSRIFIFGMKIDGTELRDPLTISGDAAATTFNPFNTNIDAVRGQEGIFATLNGKDHRSFTNGPTYNISNGALTAHMVGGSANSSRSRGLVASTMDLPSGKKWYCEVHTENMSNNDVALGIASELVRGYYELGGTSKPGAYLLRQAGQFYYPTGQLGTDSSRGYSDGDYVGIAVDLESSIKYITFYKNGSVLYSHIVDEDQGPFKFAAGTDAGSSSGYTYTFHFNFGQKPFKFPPPDGYQPLSASTTRPDTVVTDPEQYVKANIYTGSGSSRSIDVGFRPDMIWLKDRTQATHNNNVIDSLNGAPNIIIPDSAGTTLITNTTDGLTAITDTGFDLGANTGGTQSYELNKDGNDYVAWTWRAGGAPTASNSATSGAMAANSVSLDGVLQSAYTPSGSPNKYPSKMSIGTKQGFSVVQFELGPTDNKNIPHGLSEIPSFYIIKNVDAGDNYYIYTTNMDGTLDFSANFGTDAFQNSARNFPTTSTVNFESASGGTHIMYCWHDVPGLHKSGKYTGNSNSNGPVIDLGFRPALILLKKTISTDSNSGWHWYDNKRNTYNPANNFLLAGTAYYENRAQNNTADVSSYTVDFLSTGFRLSHSSNNLNYAGETYFYAAWAEAPAFSLYGAQSSAR